MKFFSLVISFLAVILLYLAFQSFSATNSFIEKSIEAKGTVVDFIIREEYNSEEEEYYDVFYPIIEFVKENEDRTYQFESDYGNNNSPKVAIGTEVNVLYMPLPNKQFHAKWNTYGALRMTETILGIIGTIVMFVSIVMFRVAVKKNIK